MINTFNKLQAGDQDNVSNRPTYSKRNSKDATTTLSDNEGTVSSKRDGGRRNRAENIGTDTTKGIDTESSKNTIDSITPAIGEQGDNELFERDEESWVENDATRDINGRRSDHVREHGEELYTDDERDELAKGHHHSVSKNFRMKRKSKYPKLKEKLKNKRCEKKFPYGLKKKNK